MNENASIVRVTTLIAGNGVVLSKAYDYLNQSALNFTYPLQNLFALVLPPTLGFVAALLTLGRIEVGAHKPWGFVDRWLTGISLIGIGFPLLLWSYAINLWAHLPK